MQPSSVHAKDTAARLGSDAITNGEKRARDDRMDEDERQSKRERTEDAEEDDDDGEEMEIEDDDDTGARSKSGACARASII